MKHFDTFRKEFKLFFDFRKRKTRLQWVVIVLAIIISYVILDLDVIGHFREIPLDSSAKNFITIVLIALLIGILRALKNLKRNSIEFKEKFEKMVSLVEWFALIMMTLPPAIEAITKNEISLYWLYFPFVIASVMWISIGVKIGGYPLKKWSLLYGQTFVIGCWILVSVGIYLHLALDLQYQYQPQKLFPWLEH
jgi:hypothetical protein